MAASNSSRSRGITIETFAWGVYARGTRDALTQHGITLAGPFPGDPGERKTACKAIDPLGREIRIKRNSKTTFAVYRDFSEEEQAFQARKRKREMEIQSAKDLVASWPKSPREFREKVAGRVDVLLQFVEAHCTYGLPDAFPGGTSGGYKFDDATMARVYELSDELRGIMEAGGIELDIELRKQQIPACIAEEVLASDASSAVEQAKSGHQYGGNVIPFRQVNCH